MWTYAVLEIYTRLDTIGLDHKPWPTSGEPADWIEDGLVGYTQGSVEDLVILTPLWLLLWWKIKGVFTR